MSLNHLLVALALLLAISFLMGVDHGLDERDAANQVDRLRLWCAMPEHHDPLCKEVK